MLTKRIIPCLDVKDNKVVKGVRFSQHQIVGDIITLAKRYVDEGADELVFYDITASSDQRTVDYQWITELAKYLTIPFCVAGGIRDKATARHILSAGADKISINSPALETPQLITELATELGSQCVVVGIDSYYDQDDYYVYQYTGDPTRSCNTQRRTLDWVLEVQDLGAGEVVINCMNQDGVRQGYDISQLDKIKRQIHIPVIASGGAGTMQHFKEVFQQAHVDGALAATVFHNQSISIQALKAYLKTQNIEVRL
jgi:imidazole glycerol-phosphate synthase subunit HisF